MIGETESEGSRLDDLVAECIVALDRDDAAGVERVLAAHPDLAGSIRARLDVLGHAGMMRGAEPAQPERIGGYRILEVLGEGGMGTVYRAEQREPVRRQAAIKVIKLGMDSKEVLARFELERRALAAMSHTNIARVYDAGTTERGQPYFVMELVAGLPITTYCDKHRLGLVQRIELFRQVCAGVQHAHQKGVMHRDLKPANILVVREDDRAVPKILDFGLAKAINRELMAQSVHTQQAVVLGTPEYMAPEQAAPDEEAIDTRADVYSLGVLLYELLTGVLPFSPEQLRRGAWAGLQRVLTEVEPPKPSSVRRELRGDLDWIVLKAMAKEPERRYDTATGLAQDLARHLDDEPVSAGPPTAAYRLGKLVKKYRGQAVAVVVVLVALLAGIVGTSIGFARARESEQLAIARLDELRQVAEFQETQLRRVDVADMAEGLREGVAAGVNFADLARDALQTQVFARTLEAIDAEFAGQPVVAAQLLRATGNAQRALGLFEPAATTLRRVLDLRREALGSDDWDTIVSLGELSAVLIELSRYDEAEPLAVEAARSARRALGDDHPDTLASLIELGRLRRAQGRFAEAERLFRDILAANRAAFPDDPKTFTSLSNLGSILVEQGKFAEAEPLLLECLEGRRRVLGEDDPALPNLYNTIGAFYTMQERLDDAEPYMRDAVATARRLLGDNHPSTLTYVNTLACAFTQVGRLDEAEPLLRDALARCRGTLGDHRLTFRLHDSLGTWCIYEQRGDEAAEQFRAALDGRRRILGPDHPDTLETMAKLGAVLIPLERHDEAAELMRGAVEGWAQHPEDATTRPYEAALYYSALRRVRGDLDTAERYGRQAVEGMQRILGEGSPHTEAAAKMLASTLAHAGGVALGEGEYAVAEQKLLEAHAIFERVFEPEDEPRLTCEQQLAALYERWHEAEPDGGHAAQAAAWRARRD